MSYDGGVPLARTYAADERAASVCVHDSYRIATGVMTKEATTAGVVYVFSTPVGVHQNRAIHTTRVIGCFGEAVYAWMSQVPFAAAAKAGQQGAVACGAGVHVCFRLHKSGAVTDVRLIGVVARVTGNFGFIDHDFFPDNMYFRFADVDAGSPATKNTANRRVTGDTPATANTIAPGTVVAFRVATKDGRMWALRVWRVPASHVICLSQPATLGGGAVATISTLSAISSTPPRAVASSDLASSGLAISSLASSTPPGGSNGGASQYVAGQAGSKDGLQYGAAERRAGIPATLPWIGNGCGYSLVGSQGGWR